MTSGIVVDIGNSRMKWGLVRDSAIVKTVSLDGDNPLSWMDCADQWQIAKEPWAIASVHPGRTQTLIDWLGDSAVSVIRDYRDVPIEVDVDQPERVGVDRLLNALAVSRYFPNETIRIVSIGTAVTVDAVSAEGTFQGGMILPGVQLMATALNQQTAVLPKVELNTQPHYPGRNTISAIQNGIWHAIVGAIQRVGNSDDRIILTGGDATKFVDAFPKTAIVPALTLEGIRIAAEASA